MKKLIKTENGTTFGEPIMKDGRRAVVIKSGHHYDTLTPEDAASLIAWVPVKKIIYQELAS
jgi:hypothetical protein